MIFLPSWPLNFLPSFIPPPSWIIPPIPPLTPVKPIKIKEIVKETYGDWIRFNWRESQPQNPNNVNAQEVPNELHPLQTTLVSTMQNINQLLPLLIIVPIFGTMMTLPVLLLLASE